MAERSSERVLQDETRQSIEPARVSVCVPAQDRVATGFAFDLARLMGFSAITLIPEIVSHLSIETVHGTLIAPQRQELVDRALHNDCTHILWLDSDMRFPKDTLYRLLAHGKPVVGANYSSRRIPPVPVALTHLSKYGDTQIHLVTDEDSTGLVPVEVVGMGVLLTRTDLFREIPKPWFTVEWSEGGNGFQGEDIYMCKKIRQAGHGLLVDQDLSREIGHVGTWVYEHVHANESQKLLEAQE